MSRFEINKKVSHSFLALIALAFTAGAFADAQILRGLEQAVTVSPATVDENTTIVSSMLNGERVYFVYLVLEDDSAPPARRMKRPLNELATSAGALQDRAIAVMDPDLAGSVTRRYKFFNVLAAELSAAQIQKVASNPFVKAITPWLTAEPQWIEAQELMGVTAVAEAPENLTGDGAVIAVFDNSFDGFHPSLGGGEFGVDNDKIIGGIDVGDNDDNPTFAANSRCENSPDVFSVNEHGTFVAAIAVGAEVVVDGGVPLRGVAPDADMVGIKYHTGQSMPNIDSPCIRSADSTVPYPADIMMALEWVMANREALSIDILTSSFRFSSFGSNGIGIPNAQQCAAQFPELDDAYDMLENQGVVSFAAAGNSGAQFGNLIPEGKSTIVVPACLESVMSVGATYGQAGGENTECPSDDRAFVEFDHFNRVPCVEADHVMASSSNADFLDLLAPGVFQTQALTNQLDDSGPQHEACAVGGTSFSTPNAAGVAALMVQKVQEAGNGVFNQTTMRNLLSSTGCCVTDTNSGDPNLPETRIVKPRVSALRAAMRLDDDIDSDGSPDVVDNCIETPNPSQRDTDGDGYGNFCDTDLNNDGVTNVIDLSLFRAEFFQTGDNYADFNSDNTVNIIDLSILRSLFFSAPGPSANFVTPEPCSFEAIGAECVVPPPVCPPG